MDERRRGPSVAAPLRYALALYAAVCLLAGLDARLHGRSTGRAARARAAARGEVAPAGAAAACPPSVVLPGSGTAR